ncbi:asparagine synthase (glutamine-hydrolyzing) [Streptomyces sp. XD-27]|uniref:asparagine synthase (glutamine-hydrolyzing) n=1 Tax=Streptomyces sp. XD-27 TaxID=3062779 RepID=UPI0026F44EFE|nr:asparagine synthase (glutamine-hydrolyzing) [Streptomyces sp. XD-27]WKX71921.1 asparagine synthase (glutamine-hydrolyzing) [Streptomyces sp. XD-27]
MCGVTGWVDFERDLTGQHDVLLAMTGTMACRGPDAEGLWTGRHALLGHRRLAVIDPARGQQPMYGHLPTRTGAETGADTGTGVGTGTGTGTGTPAEPPPAVLSYGGELYNHRELRATLAARGHRFRTDSDTEVVLAAYLHWGADFTERLDGMYGFALWDARAERLLLVRDRLGVKPLYYHPTPTGVLFGSEPKAILAHPWAEAVVDLDGMRELFALAKTPGHAVYRGMYEVRPGHVLHVSRAGLRTRPYWTLRTAEHTDGLAATVGTVRDLLDDAVARQLVADVPRCALLSGGLDSSAVTALAARRLAARGEGPLASFAVDFAGPAAGADPDPGTGTGTDTEPERASPDRPYAHAVAAHTGTDHTDIVLPAAALADPLHRTAALTARDLPIGRGERDTSLYLLFKAVRRHATVALSGEAADELFGGYGWFHDPRALARDTFPWLAEGEPGFAGTLDQLLAPALRERLGLAAYRRDRYREALAEVEHLPYGPCGPRPADARERRMREVTHLALTRFVPRLLDRKDRMSMATGLEARVPFCDHRLVGYVYNAPWSMKTHDGREKSLLRAATRDLLPAAVADRRKSPYPSTPHRAYTRAVREQFAALAADRDAPVHPLLDAGWVARTAAARPSGARSTPSARTPDAALEDYLARFGMESALLLDTWLRRYAVRLEL